MTVSTSFGVPRGSVLYTFTFFDTGFQIDSESRLIRLDYCVLLWTTGDHCGLLWPTVEYCVHGRKLLNSLK